MKFDRSLSSRAEIRYNSTNMLAVMLMGFFATGFIFTANTEKVYQNQSDIIDDMLQHGFACMGKLSINPDVCGDLVLKGKDHSDKKYDNCKCFGSCIAKEMGTMNRETGKWNWVKLKELMTLLTDESLIDEAKSMEANCFDETNTDCEAGYAMLKCALKYSKMTKEIVNSYVATLENSTKTQDTE